MEGYEQSEVGAVEVAVQHDPDDNEAMLSMSSARGAMKCRDGCEGEKAQHSVVCEACWMRLPLEEKDALGDAWVRGRGVQKAEQRALDWLAADDKRKAK